MDSICIDRGVATRLCVDLREFSFVGVAKLTLTIKNSPSPAEPVIVRREFTSAAEHTVTVTPEESLRLKDGAVYDFTLTTTGASPITCKASENGAVELRKGVGQA